MIDLVSIGFMKIIFFLYLYAHIQIAYKYILRF